jgi:hypothetical protein
MVIAMESVNPKQSWIVILRPLLALVFVAVAAGTFFAMWAWWNFGSVQTGWAYTSGYRVIPVSESIEFDSVLAGTKVHGTFVLQNLSNQDIQVIGAKPDCYCITASHFPILLKKRGQCSLDFEFLADDNVTVETVVEHHIVVNFDTAHPPLVLWMRAKVIPQMDTNNSETQNHRL